MKGYKQQLGVLLLALVLALGGLGVGYTHWADSLEISGTVNTGTWSPEFTGEYRFFQSRCCPARGCTCTFTDTTDDGELDTMEATMTDVSANCSYKLYSTIHNDGTVPMRITDIQIQNPSPELVTIGEEEGETLVGAVLDPGDEVTCKLDIEIGVADLAEYSFSVKITDTFWNQ